MQCTIVKPGHACTFAVKDGCAFGEPAETCHTVADQCEGCDHIQEWPTGRYCGVYAMPIAKWAQGLCPTATHVKVEKKTEEKRINPLKASKQKMRGR